MLQQEIGELRGMRYPVPGDSEEGFAEHSEGSLPAQSAEPADHSVMNHHQR